MKRVLALVAVGCALLVAACGGHTKTVTSTATVTSTTTAASSPAGLTCDYKTDWAIQCANPALLAKTPNPLLNKAKALPDENGTDTYGGAANVASSSLTNFDLSYLCGCGGKDWSTGDLAVWHSHGKPTGMVWEQGAAQAEDGCAQGTRDAINARNEANALGAPSYSVIHAAVDTSASGEAVKDYFICWEHELGPERAGDYGSYFVVRDLNEWGIISSRATWETRAWSEGMLYDHACLYQSAIPPMAGTSINGTGVDLDIKLCPDWGQWPYAQAAPINPLHYSWLPSTRRAFTVVGRSTKPCKLKSKVKGCHVVHAREQLAAKTFDHTGCVLDKTTHHFKRPACKVVAQHLRLLAGRLWTLAHKTKNLKHKAKRPRWGATHYKVKGHTTTLGGAYRQLRRRVTATGPIKSWA